MLKAGILAGHGPESAAYTRAELGDRFDSPSSAYAVALAALVDGDDALARSAAAAMVGDSAAFERAGRAISALAQGDSGAYRAALEAIVADFEARDRHLTGVAIADTAVMLERIAEPRGMATGIQSPVLGTRRLN
jgi:hypothetical protein